MKQSVRFAFRHLLMTATLGSALLASSAHAAGYVGKIPSALTPEGNAYYGNHGGEIVAARIFSDEVLVDSRNAQVRARMLSLAREQTEKHELHRLSREDFTLVINVGLGWDDALGANTPSYVHDFVNDMHSLGVRVVFLEKNSYGPIRDNGHVIGPQLQAVLDEGKPVMILTLCKGTPEMTVALQEVLAGKLDANRHQTGATGRIVSYLNLSGMLTGTFYSDKFGDAWFVQAVAHAMMKSKNIMRAEYGKSAAALPEMKTNVIEPLMNETLPAMPSDIFYLNVVGAPTDREFLKSGTPLGPFFRMNDALHFTRVANDGYLDITKVPFPASVGANRAIVTFNATHLLTDGRFGTYDLTDEFTRRAVYRALLEVAIERGDWL